MEFTLSPLFRAQSASSSSSLSRSSWKAELGGGERDAGSLMPEFSMTATAAYLQMVRMADALALEDVVPWHHRSYAALMGAAAIDFRAVLCEELERMAERFEVNELAYLALTSKIELPIRDR